MSLLAPREVERFRALIEERFGLAFDDSKLSLLGEIPPYDHEILLDGSLRQKPDGKTIVALPPGLPLQVLETRSGWVRVETAGPVRARGWVDEREVRRIRFPEDAVAPMVRITPVKESPDDRGPREPEPTDAGH